ncbi:MAG: hypothetical protein KKD97_16185 [Gammaproteobacteria bacterium]|nr:hypothetical protein [Gammaproteobacteria bacterium]
MADKILNQSQAEAVYSAMCHLNNVGGRFACSLNDGKCVEAWGSVRVFGAIGVEETYPDQSSFATAYGLLHG